MNVFDLQIYDTTGRALPFAGNFAVTPAGDFSRVALYDNNDALVSGASKAIVGGRVQFRTQESVGAVDIYGFTDKGYAFQLKNVSAGAIDRVIIDLNNLRQTLAIPLHFTDLGAAAAEYMSGFYLVKDAPVIHNGLGVYVAAIDATETLDMGTDSTSASNDPDGFFAALSVGTLGFQFPQVGYTVGTNSVLVDVTGGTAEWTLGELFHPANTKSASKAEGTDSTTTKNGIALFKPHVPGVGGATSAYTEQVTFTPSSGLDTFKGVAILPIQLPYVPTI